MKKEYFTAGGKKLYVLAHLPSCAHLPESRTDGAITKAGVLLLSSLVDCSAAMQVLTSEKPQATARSVGFDY